MLRKPRWKRSELAGVNLLSDPRMSESGKLKWADGEEASRTPMMLDEWMVEEDREGVYRIEENFGDQVHRRGDVRQAFGLTVKQMKKLESLVGGGDGDKLAALSLLDCRVGHLRWRCGLAATMGEGARLVTQGHVYLKHDDGKGNVLEERVRNPSMVVGAGDRISVDDKMWKVLSSSLQRRWSLGMELDLDSLVGDVLEGVDVTEEPGVKESEVRSEGRTLEMLESADFPGIPSYVEVDYMLGSVKVLWNPGDGEVTMPTGLDGSFSFYM